MTCATASLIASGRSVGDRHKQPNNHANPWPLWCADANSAGASGLGEDSRANRLGDESCDALVQHAGMACRLSGFAWMRPMADSMTKPNGNRIIGAPCRALSEGKWISKPAEDGQIRLRGTQKEIAVHGAQWARFVRKGELA